MVKFHVKSNFFHLKYLRTNFYPHTPSFQSIFLDTSGVLLLISCALRVEWGNHYICQIFPLSNYHVKSGIFINHTFHQGKCIPYYVIKHQLLTSCVAVTVYMYCNIIYIEVFIYWYTHVGLHSFVDNVQEY